MSVMPFQHLVQSLRSGEHLKMIPNHISMLEIVIPNVGGPSMEIGGVCSCGSTSRDDMLAKFDFTSL